MLKRIYIDNYKCFNNFELTFGDLTLLLGANACGKTAVFEVAGKLRDFISGDGRIDDLFSAGDLTKWTKKCEQSYELEFHLNDATFLYRLEIEYELERRLARVNREELTCNDLPLFIFDMGEVQLYRDDHSEGPKYSFNCARSGIVVAAERYDNRRLCAFRDRVCRFVTLFLNPKSIAGSTESSTDRMIDGGEGFASWYHGRLQENPRCVFRAIDRLRDVLPGFADLKLVEKGSDYRELLVEYTPPKGGAGYVYRFDQLSDGQRALIVLHLLLFADDANRTLFLDEPENFIALPELQPLLAEFEDGCGDGLPQTVLISHHPEAMDFLAEKAIWLGREPESHTRVLEFKNDTMLKVSELYAQGLAP